MERELLYVVNVAQTGIHVISDGEVWLRRGVRIFHVHSARGSYQLGGQSPQLLMTAWMKFGVCVSQWTRIRLNARVPLLGVIFVCVVVRTQVLVFKYSTD